MTPDCSETSIPRSCADAFAAGAERMARLETQQQQLSDTMVATKVKVDEMHTLMVQAQGTAKAGRWLVSAIKFVAGGVIGWFVKG